jgi:hypothetical protein
MVGETESVNPGVTVEVVPTVTMAAETLVLEA